PIARKTGTASAKGMLFDHATDCLFVTGGLAGAAPPGSITPVLPALVPFALCPCVVGSFVLSSSRRLRPRFFGCWDGILYFAPLVLIAAARLPFPARFASFLELAAGLFGYVLAASTVASMIDRATTSPIVRSEQ